MDCIAVSLALFPFFFFRYWVSDISDEDAGLEPLGSTSAASRVISAGPYRHLSQAASRTPSMCKAWSCLSTVDHGLLIRRRIHWWCCRRCGPGHRIICSRTSDIMSERIRYRQLERLFPVHADGDTAADDFRVSCLADLIGISGACASITAPSCRTQHRCGRVSPGRRLPISWVSVSPPRSREPRCVSQHSH